jgi:hypothetical protein
MNHQRLPGMRKNDFHGGIFRRQPALNFYSFIKAELIRECVWAQRER